MSKSSFRPTEVLEFRKGDYRATIATDGVRAVSQERGPVIEHQSLKKAIAYLEARDYSIETGSFNSF